MALPFYILQYLWSESTRQNALPEPMLIAYERVNNYEGKLTESFILSLAESFGFDGYRTTPVTFATGGQAANAQTISSAMARLISCSPQTDDFGEWHAWIKAFLQIHPFQDGNGRIASLLFNWAINTLDEPVPLPYYKF